MLFNFWNTHTLCAGITDGIIHLFQMHIARGKLSMEGSNDECQIMHMLDKTEKVQKVWCHLEMRFLLCACLNLKWQLTINVNHKLFMILMEYL